MDGAHTTPPALLVRRLDRLRSITAGVWVLHGAAHDPQSMSGATHLIEHLTLRRCGSHDRPSLARLVDRLGGEVDAWTAAEMMGITVQTTVDMLAEALTLLCDAILEPTFSGDDVALEQRVIMAELELVQDDPAEQVDEAILAAAWGRHALARPVIGSRRTLTRLTPQALRRHHAGMIEPGAVLVGIAGAVDPADVAPHVARLPLLAPPVVAPLPPLRWRGGHRSVERDGSDQVHARLAFPALAAGDPATSRLAVLNRLLGVGASSRLFQRLREEEGLTYDIWSGLVLRVMWGLLEIGFVCAPSTYATVLGLITEELRRLPGDLDAEEVEVAKEGLVRGLEMDAESPAGLCSLEVTERLHRGRSFDLEQAIGEITSVRLEEVREQARAVLRLPTMASAVCGPKNVAERVA